MRIRTLTVSLAVATSTAPELRLITCGGEFDDDEGSYEDNVVVYAQLVGSA